MMLLGLGVSLAARSRADQPAPASSVAVKPERLAKPKTSAPPPKASSAPAVSAQKHPNPPKKPRVLLERGLAVIASDWALLAPGVLQNDGLEPNKKTPFGKAASAAT